MLLKGGRMDHDIEQYKVVWESFEPILIEFDLFKHVHHLAHLEYPQRCMEAAIVLSKIFMEPNEIEEIHRATVDHDIEYVMKLMDKKLNPKE